MWDALPGRHASYAAQDGGHDEDERLSLGEGEHDAPADGGGREGGQAHEAPQRPRPGRATVSARSKSR